MAQSSAKLRPGRRGASGAACAIVATMKFPLQISTAALFLSLHLPSAAVARPEAPGREDGGAGVASAVDPAAGAPADAAGNAADGAVAEAPDRQDAVPPALGVPPPVAPPAFPPAVPDSQPSATLPQEPASAPVARLRPPGGRFRVDTIAFDRKNALTGSKTISRGDKAVYEIAEKLHVVSRESILARRLLFAPGDIVDSQRLAESERLLRDERFIAECEIAGERLPDGRNLVRVTTWDQWSTTIPLSMSFAGGELAWLAGIKESNLLGTGQTIQLVYSSTPLRTTWSTGYANSALFGRRGQLVAYWNQNSDGHVGQLEVGLPVRSTAYDRWTWLFLANDRDSTDYLFLPTSLRARLERRYPADGTGSYPTKSPILLGRDGSHSRLIHLEGGRIFGDRIQFEIDAVAQAQLDSQGMGNWAPAALPDSLIEAIRDDREGLGWWKAPRPDRDDRRLGVSFKLRSRRYWKARNFQNLKWSEDVALGWVVQTTALWNADSRGSERADGWLQHGGSWSEVVAGSHYVAGLADLRYFLGGRSPITEGTGTWRTEYRFLGLANLQTLLRARGDSKFAISPRWAQVTLGEDNGLPGFAARQFVGRSSGLVDIEQRWTPPLEAFTVAPALAAFAALGRVGDEPGVFGSGKLHAGAGVGLRFGLTRSIDGVVNHLSISHPIGEDGDWRISFGAKQTL